MTDSDNAIEATVRAHWMNRWFLSAFARPEVVVDGISHVASWGVPLKVSIAAGRHRVAAGARYLGTSWLLGTVSTDIDVPPGETVRVVAINGWRNGHPFRITVTPP